MVLKIDIKEFYKRVDYRPAYDSNGGGDYVNGVDDWRVEKPNHRFPYQDQDFNNLRQLLDRLTSVAKSDYGISQLYDFIDSKDMLVYDKMSFERGEFANLIFWIQGLPSVAKLPYKNELVLPLANFIDWIEEGDEQFSIVTGNTDLFEIQQDWNTPSTKDYLVSNKRWYRLGHTGAETTPALVTVQHALSTRANWGTVDIRFKDYDNNPSGKTQVIRFKSDEHNEYIEIILDQDQVNYRYSSALWNGSSLVTLTNQDTGVARSTGEHTITFISIGDGASNNISALWIDTTAVFMVTNYMEYVDDLEFESKNDSGSQDYFDILRYNVYTSYLQTLSAGVRTYIYIDADGDIKYSTNLPDSNSILLYDVQIPSGATTLDEEYITDYRAAVTFLNNINLRVRNIDPKTIYETGLSENRILYFNNSTDLATYLGTASNVRSGDVIVLTGTWDFTWSTTYNSSLDEKHVRFIGNRSVRFLLNNSSSFLEISGNGSYIFDKIVFSHTSSSDYVTISIESLAEFTRFVNCKFVNTNGGSGNIRLNGLKLLFEKCYFEIYGSATSVPLQLEEPTSFIFNGNYFNFKDNKSGTTGRYIYFACLQTIFVNNHITITAADSGEYIIELMAGYYRNNVSNNYIEKGSSAIPIFDNGTENIIENNTIVSAEFVGHIIQLADIESALSITKGDAVGFDTGTGKIIKADASSGDEIITIGIATETKTGTGSNDLRVLVQGTWNSPSHGFSVGDVLYTSTTAGGLTTTAPSGSGDLRHKVGIVNTTNILYINPDLHYEVAP